MLDTVPGAQRITPAEGLAHPQHDHPAAASPERATERCGMNRGESSRQPKSVASGVGK